ncbi:receptor tyrosine-protein kinase erbB-4-like [Saccoglossus kowalevskii]|uniref:Receptor tyrosine-protein kinase erbB-4-like n=1 Tax=Saccoglossus kowalevskii TaxID=10224 RepID=A0ABM0GK30_SACKO|nr:PREDICTED: receptor tyrosine-protein kinase erbB-4-like [Saccoglossus kowalevskii]
MAVSTSHLTYWLLMLFFSYARTQRVCPGFGREELRGHDQVDELNIDMFKNCSIIDGNVVITEATFQGNQFFGLVGIDAFQLNVFSTVRIITGYLMVLASDTGQRDLSVFSNLEYIYGEELESGYSLIITGTNLVSLGLKSMSSIIRGNVYIRRNPFLCYLEPILGILPETVQRNQGALIAYNRPPDICRNEGHVCNEQCSSMGCWGPGADECGSCASYRLDDTCIDSCNRSDGLYIKSEAEKECGRIEEEAEGVPGILSVNCNGDNYEVCLAECHTSLETKEAENIQLQAEVDRLTSKLNDMQERLRILSEEEHQEDNDNQELL